MNERSPRTNTASRKPPSPIAISARLLGELLWYVQVVESGSFSRAAAHTGIAKSSLSRHIMQLEKSLGVQLLNRNTRLLAMTTVGEQIYRHALEMIASLEAVQLCAQETSGTPGGSIRLATPSALADWTLDVMAEFQRKHPKVQFAMVLEDGIPDLVGQRLDLALSLHEVPSDSSTIVARPLAELTQAIVGTPALIASLGQPRRLDNIPDNHLLALASNARPQPWHLQHGMREIYRPALLAGSTQTLLKAARAGLGLACLPHYICRDDLANHALQLACLDEPLPSVHLYALTPPHKGITATARHLIEQLRRTLSSKDLQGINLLF